MIRRVLIAAVPLGPTLCGVLVLYSLYLPIQLGAAAHDDTAATWNRRFTALTMTVSVTIVAGFAVAHTSWQSLLPRWQTGPDVLKPVLYAAWTAGCFWLMNARVVPWLIGRGWHVPSRKPWPEMTAGLMLAWLFLLA